MTREPPPLVIVLDPGDDAAVTRAALKRNNPAAGVLTIHPTPSSEGVAALAHDLLASLGKPPNLSISEELAGEKAAWNAAVAWCVGEQIRQIAVLRTHLFGHRRWAHLAELRAATGALVIAYCHAQTVPNEAGATLAATPHAVVSRLADAGDAFACWHDALPARDSWTPPAPDTDEKALAQVPRSDLAHFRADALRQLGADQFALVDAHYQAGLRAACTWVVQQREYLTALAAPDPPPFTPRYLHPDDRRYVERELEQRLDRATLASLEPALLCVGRRSRAHGHPYAYQWNDLRALQQFLTALVAACTDTSTSIARLRGAQAGFLMHGLLLALPPGLPYSAGPGISTVALTGERVTRLRTALAHPLRAAALTAAMITGEDPATLSRLAADAVDTAATRLELPPAPGPHAAFARETRVYGIPECVRGIFRAALAYHHAQRAPADGFLSGGIGQDGRNLRASAHACDINIPALTVPGRSGHHQRPLEPWHVGAQCWWVGDPIHGPQFHDASAGRAP